MQKSNGTLKGKEFNKKLKLKMMKDWKTMTMIQSNSLVLMRLLNIKEWLLMNKALKNNT